ncbi:hypothetical protein [Halalkalicoccus salilacus]|uniref:hypothetical protein n=1 Tax=Halalkalicoccus sp. GCM10025704 TaxID=3252662 RepID=UPI003614E968
MNDIDAVVAVLKSVLERFEQSLLIRVFQDGMERLIVSSSGCEGLAIRSANVRILS